MCSRKDLLKCNRRDMCVQDPFDLSHNTAKAMTREYMLLFVELCYASYNAMV